MAFDKAFAYLKEQGMEGRVMTFSVSSATVELAAQAVGCEPAHIAKSLTFMGKDGPVMIVAAGDAKVANGKYKSQFETKAKMLTPDEVDELIGHSIGGVCPFGINKGVKIYLDVSLKRFGYVYPACGNSASAVKLTPAELETLSHSCGWIDVCNLPEDVQA